MLNPANYATPQDFARAATTRFLDYAIKTGKLSRNQASKIRTQTIRATGTPVKRKTKKIA